MCEGISHMSDVKRGRNNLKSIKNDDMSMSFVHPRFSLEGHQISTDTNKFHPNFILFFSYLYIKGYTRIKSQT